MAKAKYTRQANGKFVARVWDGTYENGKKHYKYLTTKKSSKALEDMVAQFKADVNQRKIIRKSDITFCEYAARWREIYKAQKSNATKAMYDRIIKSYFCELEGIKLTDIERIHFQLLLNSSNGKPRTQQQIALTFKQVLKSAVSDHLFPTDVMADIFNSIEQIKYKSPEKRALTEYERNSVFKADFSEMDKIYVYLLYGCGIRREEALALTIFDFNVSRREVTINKAHDLINNVPEQKSPKSENGYRTIPIPAKVFPAIESYIAHLKEHGRTYLFTMRNGNPVTKNSYRKMWERIIKAMQAVSDEQIQGLTAHVFRHNYCTNLCYQIPQISIKKIAQLMGDTEAVVLKVYNHMILEKEDAVSAINSAMNY